MPEFYQTADRQPALPEDSRVMSTRDSDKIDPLNNHTCNPEPRTEAGMRMCSQVATGIAIVELERCQRWLLALGHLKESKSQLSIIKLLEEHSNVINPPRKKH